MLKQFLRRNLVIAASATLFIGIQSGRGDGTLSQWPAPLQAAIQKQLENGTLQTITPTHEDGVIIYDVEIQRDGHDRDLTFSASGQLLSEEIPLSAVPPEARKAIRSRVGKGRIQSVTRNTEGDEVTYEVDMKKAGRERSFTLDANGALIDQEVFLPELPEAVRKTVVARAAGASIDSVDKVIDDGDTSYVAQLTQGAASRSLTVSPEGEVVSIEVFLNELPARVQRAIQQESAGGRITDIEKSIEDGETSYTADVVTRGQARTVTVWEDGDIESETSLPEAPKAVQNAIRSELKDGSHLDSIIRTLQDGETAYEAELTRAGTVRTLDFDPDGNLTYREEPVALAHVPQAVQTKLAAMPGKVLEINQCDEDGDITYSAVMTNEGKTTNLTFTATGEVAPEE